MLHTALFFIIHNSPNSMAGIVFIIILCKGEVENHCLDFFGREDSDGFELKGFWLTRSYRGNIEKSSRHTVSVKHQYRTIHVIIL